MFVTSAFAQDEAGHDAQATDTAGTATDAAAAGQTHSETGVAEGHGGGVFPPFDQTTFASQLLWLVITFGLFYLIIQKVIVPRIGGILESRAARISADLDQAARMKADADAAVQAYEQDLAAARARGQEIASAARDAAKAKADAERAALEAGLAEKMTAAEARIGEIKAKAFADVGAVAEETASVIVEQLTGTGATAGEIAAAVASAKQEG